MTKLEAKARLAASEDHVADTYSPIEGPEAYPDDLEVLLESGCVCATCNPQNLDQQPDMEVPIALVQASEDEFLDLIDPLENPAPEAAQENDTASLRASRKSICAALSPGDASVLQGFAASLDNLASLVASLSISPNPSDTVLASEFRAHLIATTSRFLGNLKGARQ